MKWNSALVLRVVVLAAALAMLVLYKARCADAVGGYFRSLDQPAPARNLPAKR